jgi:hypothetical protein
MEVNMRRYRVELVCESGADEPEEVTLRTSTDAANALRSVFEGADREKFVVMMLNAKHRAIAEARRAAPRRNVLPGLFHFSAQEQSPSFEPATRR